MERNNDLVTSDFLYYRSSKEYIWRRTQKQNNPPPQPPNHAPPQLPPNPPPQPPPKSLPELLKEHDLPLGLFPKNITGYNFDVNTREITVNVPRICDVSVLQFSKTVTGCLEKGRLKDINGIRTQSFTWVKVDCIEIKSIKGKLHLDLTGKVLDKRRRFDEFATLKDGIPF